MRAILFTGTLWFAGRPIVVCQSSDPVRTGPGWLSLIIKNSHTHVVSVHSVVAPSRRGVCVNWSAEVNVVETGKTFGATVFFLGNPEEPLFWWNQCQPPLFRPKQWISSCGVVLGEKCFDISKVDVRTQNEFVRIVRMKVKDEFLEKEIRRRKGNRFWRKLTGFIRHD